MQSALIQISNVDTVCENILLKVQIQGLSEINVLMLETNATAKDQTLLT